MPITYQQTISGLQEFIPPRYNIWTFLDHVALRRPKLLDPHRHGDLIIEFAHFIGLNPDRWSRNICPILWLMKISPDIERACRRYRADAH